MFVSKLFSLDPLLDGKTEIPMYIFTIPHRSVTDPKKRCIKSHTTCPSSLNGRKKAFTGCSIAKQIVTIPKI